MEKLILKDLDSANKILELALPFLENPDQFNYDFEVNNEQLVVHMKIYGSKFNDSITGQVARGLWEFQREIYRAVAFTLYGQASIKKLTKEDLEKYNLIFKLNLPGTYFFKAIQRKFISDRFFFRGSSW